MDKKTILLVAGVVVVTLILADKLRSVPVLKSLPTV